MKEKSEEAKRELLLSWQNRAVRASLAHYFQAHQYRTWHEILTTFNLLSSISVLFLANNSLISSGGSPNQIWLSIAGLAVVLTTTLQYVLKLDEKIFDHKLAGNEFTKIKRDIEVFLCGAEINDSDIKEIKSDHGHTSKNHLLVRQPIWDKISKREAEAMEENKSFLNCVTRNNS